MVIWFERMISMAIPIATLGALAVSVYLYAKNKGTMDAQEKTVKVYKELAAAREESIEELSYERDELKKQVVALEASLDMQKEVMCAAIDELVKGFKRAGVTVGKPKMEMCEEEK